MLVVENPYYKLHDPYWKFILGNETYEVKDKPVRIELIREALSKDGRFEFVSAKRFPENIIMRMHPYQRFIKQVSESIQDEAIQIYPDLFPGEGAKLPRAIDPLWAGLYCTDCVTPIMKHTYNAARGSAESAMTAAELLAENKEKVVYALCRPSGHHAGPRVFGGYCYFNNAAIAADMLSKKGSVAILDIDYHHGNGTQEFFCRHESVFTCSIHGDPEKEYPYFWGYVNELAEGPVIRANLNIPLPIGADSESYLKAVDKAIAAIKKHSPAYLIISAGFDTHEKDPIGGFKLTSDVYLLIGKRLAALEVPTLICQEGGYNLDVLSESVHNLLSGFMNK